MSNQPSDDKQIINGTIEVPAGTGSTQQVIDTPGRRAFRRFLRHRLAMFGVVVLTIMALAAIFAPLLAPYDPAAQDLVNFRQAPSSTHWLGTDGFGRDVLSRLIYGARPSLSVGLIAVTYIRDHCDYFGLAGWLLRWQS